MAYIDLLQNNGGTTKNIFPNNILCNNLTVLGTATGTFPSPPPPVKVFGGISSSMGFMKGIQVAIPMGPSTWTSNASTGTNSYLLDAGSSLSFALGPSNRGIAFGGLSPISARITIFVSMQNSGLSSANQYVGLYQNAVQLQVASYTTVGAGAFATASTSVVVTLSPGDVIYMGMLSTIAGPTMIVDESNISIQEL